MSHAEELSAGERFAFGANWARFLDLVDQGRIDRAAESLRRMLGPIQGKTFLDVGCGSGLFSLAAARLGASVHSFDYDPECVGCTAELKRRHAPSSEWTVEAGSALDGGYLRSLGAFDVVYSWGVLHHTGALWKALEGTAVLVNPGGLLYIAIYNDQGWKSGLWRRVKRFYNVLPSPLRPFYVAAVLLPRELRFVLGQLLRGSPGRIVARWRDSSSVRGMNVWRDWNDWVGGYPFEVATPDRVFEFLTERGFVLAKLKTCGGGLGCNEFVFRRAAR